MKEHPLLTPMGEIEVFFDGISVSYETQSIECNAYCRDLTGRFLIRLHHVPDEKPHTIACKIKGYVPSPDDQTEPGERLECKSFYQGHTKLSIGMEGDSGYLSDGTRISAYDYDNSFCENGVQYDLLPFTKTSDYVFCLAWMEGHDPENESQTWFGADPTML